MRRIERGAGGAPRSPRFQGRSPSRLPAPPAGVAELADAPGLGPGGPSGPWRFDPSRPHRRRTDMSEYDRDFWEERWSQALREHGDRLAQRPPNAHLTAEVGDLRPGRALDAGCGHGPETLWLATHGWQVTAVDFAATALAYARSTAEATGPDIAERIDWVEADLANWTPRRDGTTSWSPCTSTWPGRWRSWWSGWRQGSRVAGRCSSSAIARSTPLPERRLPQRPGAGVGRAARAALDPGRWELLVVEERPRPAAGAGVDAVIRARRRF